MESHVRKGSKCHSFLGQEMTCLPDTFTDIEEEGEIQVLPTNSLSDSDKIPVEYRIVGTPDRYLHLGDSYIHIRIRVVKKNGEVLKVTDIVTPVNLFVHALFSTVDVYVNDEPITKCTGPYPFRAYIGTQVAYSKTAKESWLQNEICFNDTEGDPFDDLKIERSKNGGHILRNELAAESRVIDAVFKPHVDIFMQNRPIPPSTNVLIRMTRSSPQFSLMTESKDEFKIQIQYACLHVRVLKLSHSVTLNHKEALLSNNQIKYPIRRVQILSFTIPKDVLSFTKQNLIHGQIPLFIIMGITSNEAFSGTYTKSPFRFDHFNLERANLDVNGKCVPSRPYSFKFNDDDKTGLEYTRSMRTLCGLLHPKYGDVGNGITRKMYEAGYTLIPFVITPSYSTSSLSLMTEGTVHLDMVFGKVREKVVNVVLYVEYENTVLLGKHGHVSIDF